MTSNIKRTTNPQQISNAKLKVVCFGAGQEVGRSSILVEIGKKKIILDCGVNFTALDEKERLPKYQGNLNDINLVLVSHIHTDHLAAVPYLTEILKCPAPVYMTRASYLMMPTMLEDFIKVTDNPPYNKEDLNNCLKKIHTIEFYSRFEPIEDVFVQAFPAGHILGACAFYVTHNGLSFVYTGDFSSVSDHHLSGHCIPRLFPNILITESTYGNRVRDPIAKRERSFVQMVHAAVEEGGKVLIPVFAVGRLQEICLMLEDYWERMEYTDPIFYATGMGDKAMQQYKKCVTWMNPTVQTNYFDYMRTAFNFNYTKPAPNTADLPTDRGFVMLATSGMLNYRSMSYNYFVEEKWYDDPRNLIIFPGYCGPSTLGRAVLTRDLESNRVFFQNRRPDKTIDITIRCKVETVSFSAHADQFEIVSMVERVRPDQVITVHGDQPAVETLASRIVHDTGIPAASPQNLTTIYGKEGTMTRVAIDRSCVQFMRNLPARFEGVVAGASLKGEAPAPVTSAERAARMNGYRISEIHMRRRVRTAARIEDVFAALETVGITEEMVSHDEERNILHTPAVDIEFVEGGLVLAFRVSEKGVVDKMMYLLQV